MLTLNWFFYAEDIQTCFLIIPFLVWQSSDLTTHPLLSSIPLLNVIMFIFSCAILATNYSFTYLVTVYLETIRPQFSPFLSNILCIVVYMKYNINLNMFLHILLYVYVYYIYIYNTWCNQIILSKDVVGLTYM